MIKWIRTNRLSIKISLSGVEGEDFAPLEVERGFSVGLPREKNKTMPKIDIAGTQCKILTGLDRKRQRLPFFLRLIPSDKPQQRLAPICQFTSVILHGEVSPKSPRAAAPACGAPSALAFGVQDLVSVINCQQIVKSGEADLRFDTYLSKLGIAINFILSSKSRTKVQLQ